MEQLVQGWSSGVSSIGIVVGAALVGWVVHWIVYSVATRLTEHTESVADNSFVRHSRRPARAILPLLAVLFVTPALSLSPEAIGLIRHAVSLGLIASVAWGIVELTWVMDDLVDAKYRMDIEDNLQARQMQTQIHVLRRFFVVAVSVIAVSVMLMTFDAIRALGASLLASAGLAGLAIGMAARPALSNLIAGVQIALTQPIRLDDVVVIDGEWGRIEEITTTYVVVRIWDQRRLVVPFSRVIEQPFQNWTRTTADILGAVYLYTDYTVPVEELRQELHRILESSEWWDGEVWNLQVTDATEQTVELRALMSAPNSGAAWNLRCHAREKLIAYLQRQYPESLPRTRAELAEGVVIEGDSRPQEQRELAGEG